MDYRLPKLPPQNTQCIGHERIDKIRFKENGSMSDITNWYSVQYYTELDYEKKPEFSYTVRRLRLFIQSCYEQNLYGFAWAGAFAALRNIGRNDWKDEITENQNTIITNVNPNVQSSTTPLSNSESEVKP